MMLRRSKPLERRTPLRARAGLRRRPKRQVMTVEQWDARLLWKTPTAGFCQCGCGRFSLYLERHHVVSQMKLKQIGRHDQLWNLANGMLLTPTHHEWHTNHARKIKIEYVPEVALAFALDVLGEGGAAAYVSAHYDCTVTL